MSSPRATPIGCDPEGHVDALVHAAIHAADPGEALHRAWPSELDRGPWDVVAVGKAAGPMLARAASLTRIGRAICVGSPGTLDKLHALQALADVREADHPVPTERNIDASRAAAEFVSSARERCLHAQTRGLLVLLSGGASSLLTLPSEPLSLHDIQRLTRHLLRAGAPIEHLNCVRRHLEVLKGGGVARLAAPIPLWTFILSDVLGDDLPSIGSGPTCADPSTCRDALGVLETYAALDVSPPATSLLRAGARGERADTLKPRDPALKHVHHRIIANNSLAVDAAARTARQLGYSVIQTTCGVQGEARVVGRRLANQALHLQSTHPRACAVIIGGETTVSVSGDGLGGRNQELALAAAIEIAGNPRTTIASFGTDGVDGPTDAAGAVATGWSVQDARTQGTSAEECLQNNDSHRFFGACDSLIRTGPTGTNVNDVAVALIRATK